MKNYNRTIQKNANSEGISTISVAQTKIQKSANNSSDINEDVDSVDQKECIKTTPLLWPQIIAALACGFVHLNVGAINGYTGVLLPALTNPNSTDIYLTTGEVAIFSSISNLGAIVGSFSNGIVMTWVGQRASLLFALPLGACSWIILTVSKTLFLLILSRLLLGFTLGIYLTTCHNFVAEIAHTSVRGRLISMCDLLRQVGVLFIYILGSTNIHWRAVGLIAGLTSIIPPFIVFLFLPNSPRWLATVNRNEDAKASLTFYRGAAYDIDKELNEIVSQTEGINRNLLPRLSLFKKPKVMTRFITLSIMMLIVHFTGNAVFTTYSVTIFKSARTDVDEYMSTIVSGLMRLFGALTFTVIADRFNRKLLIVGPLCISAISISVLGFYFYIMDYYDVKVNWLPIASVLVYTYTTSMYYPVILCIRAELLPNDIRSIASGLHFVFLSLGIFFVVFCFPYMVQQIGNHFTFWIYGIVCFLIIIIVIAFIPETKNKSLEEIYEIK